MRLVHLTASVTRSAGGLFYAVSGLTSALARRGHEVEIVGGHDDFLDEDRAQWGDVPVTSLATSGYGFHHKLLSYARNSRADIIHVQGIWTAVTMNGLYAASGSTGSVVSPHGMLDPWILKRSPAKKAVHGALFEKPLLRRSVVHALCASEQRSVQAYYPSIGERVHVVPNGIDLPGGDTGDLATKSGTLYLSRVHEKKQTIELVKAWDKGPGQRGEKLTVAGWGSPDYEARLREAASATANVTFVGSAYGEEKARLLSQARYFILPSLSEGLPMAVLEALSYGVIPIITSECNLPELTEDGTALDLREDLQNLDALYGRPDASDVTRLVAHATACKARALDYRWDMIAERMEALYDEARALAARRG